MPNNSFKLPGSDLLRIGHSFLPGGKNNPQSTPKDKPSGKPKDTGLSQGGGGGRRKPVEPALSSDLEALDMTPAEAPAEEKAKEPEAVLSEGAWLKPDTLFHEEAEVCVKLTSPQGKEHLTRVEAELYAKRPSGPVLISKGEGNADKDGKANIRLAIYKPDNHQGEIVEYFVTFKHRLAKLFQPDTLLRKIQEIALKSADHILVPGIVFEKNSSFIHPKVADGLKTLESSIKEWEKKFPKGKIVIFGHANPDEEYGKLLSERRAQSAYAFITNDADMWESLYNKEKWGVVALQHLLKDLGYFKATPNNLHGPQTRTALKAFQKKSGLTESGKEDATTRKALFSAYMQGKHDIKIDASRFRKVTGNPWMGCSANNRTVDDAKPAQENRRVAFILIDESKYFPVNFPCQDGAEAGCAGQCKKAGARSSPGIKCAFYNELLLEKKQPAVAEDGDELDSLLAKDHLDAKDIGKARALIIKRPTGQWARLYTNLQSKVKYHSQRDNAQVNSLADRMCNLTSLAMSLEYLGIENPEPSIQFEDYLEKERVEKGYPARTDGTSWDKLAGEFNVEMDAIPLMTSDPAILKSKLKPEIEKGRGVVISIFSSASGKGHIVRLQSVQEDGLIVDDPFGKLNNFKQREDGGSGYTGTANTRTSDSKIGEDNLWTWENIGETVIKYADAFYPKE